MRRWRFRLRNLVEDKDGLTWTADGACMFPFGGYNFARAEKARIGWWVYRSDRWVTMDRTEFQVRWVT